MEDRTVPRVCVCPHLLGCLIGYAQAHDDFRALASDGSEEQDGYNDGWKIYGFEFDAALKPNTKMVYDANASGEVWLTAFNSQTAEYSL